MLYVREYFSLLPENENRLFTIKPKFGYNGFGEFVFNRTYSRLRTRPNGSQTNETFHECILRVVNGVMTIRKDYYLKNNIDWREDYWQTFATTMGKHMVRMNFLPPGRGLWAMGTPYLYKQGSMPLFNCAYADLGNSGRFGNDIHWMMDALMLGVGVGFSPLPEHLTVYPIKDRQTYVHDIPDSREGWIDSVKLLIDAHLNPANRVPIFRYHLIRPKGQLINGFGGLASGPAPLKEFHEMCDGQQN